MNTERRQLRPLKPCFPDGLRTALDGLPDGLNLKKSPSTLGTDDWTGQIPPKGGCLTPAPSVGNLGFHSQMHA